MVVEFGDWGCSLATALIGIRQAEVDITARGIAMGTIPKRDRKG